MRVVIVGAGDIGFQLGKRLSRSRVDISIVESNTDRIQRAGEQIDCMLVEGHGASAAVLKRAGVDDANLLAALTDNDEVNILACQLAKKAGVATTIARVRNPEFMMPDYTLSTEELGVDHFIHPEKETADTIVRLVRQASATNVVDFEGGKVRLVGVRLQPGSPLLRTPLMQLVSNYGDPPMRIVAIARNQVTMIPRGEDEMIPGDHVFAMCDPDYVDSFVEHTGKKDITVSDIMILGGGLVGQFVARDLSDEMNVKVVESNVARSREIANILPDTLIIHGDGTDIDLMAVEG